ncbi:MAG: hypothetical protein OEZ11_09335 [Gammaproteobacteria bacterium]|nr:hypothetical protein [Gammaproteobacteria bacterium]
MATEQFAAFEEIIAAPGIIPGGDNDGRFRPESPFLPEPEYSRDVALPSERDRPVAAAVREAIESPFVSEYVLETADADFESPEEAYLREVMEELYDEEFNEAVEDLVNHLRGVHEDRFRGELDHDPVAAEQELAHYLEPLNREIESAIDSLIEGLVQIDNDALTEEQLDAFLESADYEANLEEPEFQFFFKKIWRKAKKLAKKGLKVIKKLSPVHIILGKLKKLVRPLLMRVLKFALNKIPARFRPIAKRLARRFLKGTLGEVAEEDFDGEYIDYEDSLEQADQDAIDPKVALPPPSIVATEFDTLLAGYVIEGPDYDHDPSVVQYMNQDDMEERSSGDMLDRAKDQFIRGIASAESEEQAIAEVERFIPAILMGLKLGIKVIGRRRVVNFLAKLVAKLISRFVGRQAAVPLSRALVDAGLSLVSLETPEDMQYATGEVLAETIEDTITDIVTEVPEEAFDDEEMLELYAQEAFDRAVAKNFPPQMLRRRLRRVPHAKATWIVMPRGRRAKKYKKYSQTFPVKLSAPMARRIRTFGGQTLYGYLMNQLGLPVDKQSIKGRLHLYEGMRGASLSDISHLERKVDGLGSRERAAWMKIHPLTPQAAALLIPQHVGLAQNVSERFLVNRLRTAIGQRFYYLEIPGARMLRAPAGAAQRGTHGNAAASPARANELNVTFDFRSQEIRIYDFISEAKATRLVREIRKGAARATFVRHVRMRLSRKLRRLLTGPPDRHIRFAKDASSAKSTASIAPALRFAGKTVSRAITNLVTKSLLGSMRKDNGAILRQFAKAAEAREDGVTVQITISRASEVFAIFQPLAAKRIRALSKLRQSGIDGALSVKVQPGFHK